MMELLSPAGSFEAMKAAVLSGADAVYFGASSFQARANAKNFTEDEIAPAIRFCREHGVQTYVTMNTLISDRELPEALEVAKRFSDAGASAFIVQDLGFASILKQCTDTPLHASTQMTVHNAEGAIRLKEYGFRRVVLARELSSEEIGRIISAADVETEVFVHGALCMCYSGQCYMSSMIGKRSGNRGQCAQPCRLPYQNGYPLSLKDLCLLRHLKELEACGVTSLKIEGRMKSPSYVGAVTSVYAACLRGEPYTPEKEAYLAEVFSRDGFTDGYFKNQKGPSMFGTHQKSTESYQVPSRPYKRIGLALSVIQQDDLLTFRDENSGMEVSVPAQKAQNRPTDETAIRNAMERLGDTVYYIETFSAQIRNDLFVPASVLNQARRDLLDHITQLRLLPNAPFRTHGIPPIPAYRPTPPKPTIQAQFTTLKNIPGVVDADFIWLPLTEAATEKFQKIAEQYPQKVGAVLPRIIHDHENAQIEQWLCQCRTLGIRDILCGNLGHMDFAQTDEFRLHGDFGLNVWNTHTVRELRALGFASVTLSFELNKAQIRDCTNETTGFLAYGRLPFMIMENCIKKHHHQPELLTDRIGKQFPVTCEFGCRNQIWNADKLYLADKDLRNLGFARLLFTDETTREITEILHAYRTGEPADIAEKTRGWF